MQVVCVEIVCGVADAKRAEEVGAHDEESMGRGGVEEGWRRGEGEGRDGVLEGLGRGRGAWESGTIKGGSGA